MESKVQFSGGQPSVVDGTTTATAPAAEATTEEPKYLTLADLQAARKEIEDAAFNRARSYVDKGRTAIEQRFNEKLQALQQAGIQPDANQQAALRKAAESEALVSVDTQPTPANKETQTNTRTAGEDDQQADPLTRYAWDIMDEEETIIEPGDPEAEIMASAQPANKREVRQIVLQAIAAKKTRLARAGTPLSGGRGPQSQDALAEEMLALARNPTKNWDRIQEIKKLLK